MTEKTFIRITNRDILNKIEGLFNEIKQLKEKNTEQHNTINKHLIKTNGKVKLNKWIGSTALAIGLIAIGYVINHAYQTI